MKKHCWIIFIFILVACSSNSGLESTSATPYTSLSIATSTVTWTVAPTLNPTSTKIPSHPISTPSKIEKTEITLELLRTNNGCELPCWWGIIPNQTQWSDAEKFLKLFSDINLSESSTWSVYFAHSPLSTEFSEVYEVRTVFAVQDGMVKEIEAGYFDEESYHLPNFLSRVGQPTKILMLTFSSDSGMPPGKVPFIIALYYPQKGIMATFGAEGDVKGSLIEACIKKGPSLFLWSPMEYDRSVDYILGWDKDQEKYLEIADATQLSTSDFYEKFSNTETPVCLQTPTNLWPSQ